MPDGDFCPPDHPGAELGRDDAGVCGAAAGEGFTIFLLAEATLTWLNKISKMVS